MFTDTASPSLWSIDTLRAHYASGRLVVGTTSAYVNRTIDPNNVTRLAKAMNPAGLSFSPIILAHFDGKYYVVDGSHRIIALVTPKYKLEERITQLPVFVWNVHTEGDLYTLVARSQAVINDRRKHQQYELCMSAFSADLDGAEASSLLLANKPDHMTVDAWLKWFVLDTAATTFIGDADGFKDNNTHALYRGFLRAAEDEKNPMNKLELVTDFIHHAKVTCKRYLPLLNKPQQLSVGLVLALGRPSIIRKPSIITTYLKEGKRGIEQKFGVTKAGGAFQVWLCRAAQGKETGV